MVFLLEARHYILFYIEDFLTKYNYYVHHSSHVHTHHVEAMNLNSRLVTYKFERGIEI